MVMIFTALRPFCLGSSFSNLITPSQLAQQCLPFRFPSDLNHHPVKCLPRTIPSSSSGPYRHSCTHTPSPAHPSPATHSLTSQAQHPNDILPDTPLILRPALAPHLGRLDIRGALIIRLGQHAHDAEQDLLDALDGAPALRRVLVV